jgi:DNA primase
VFCFDGDRAGRQAAWRALENALPLARDGRELKFLFLPEGHDPDTLVAEEGAAAFENRLKTALPLSEYLLQQLLPQVDLTNVDGRAKLKALAQPLFARMPEGVYRELLADRLATEIRMPAAKLKELLFAAGAGAANRRTAADKPEPAPRPRGRMVAGRGNLLTQAITLVLHHPSAAAGVENPELLGMLPKPGMNVLQELLEQAAAATQPTTAVLLERWRERAEYARLTELAMAEPLVADAEAAAQELRMAVKKLLEEHGPGRRMDELLQKAEDLGLNTLEKAELSELLKAKGTPKAGP